jgi:hypothetical protein
MSKSSAVKSPVTLPFTTALPGAEMEPLKVTPVPMTKLFATTTLSAISESFAPLTASYSFVIMNALQQKSDANCCKHSTFLDLNDDIT